MESLSNDLYSIIINFLSVKDRIILREVNNNFEQIINKKIYHLKTENNLRNIFLSTEPSFHNMLILIVIECINFFV